MVGWSGSRLLVPKNGLNPLTAPTDEDRLRVTLTPAYSPFHGVWEETSNRFRNLLNQSVALDLHSQNLKTEEGHYWMNVIVMARAVALLGRR